jgi:hypothetical protein
MTKTKNAEGTMLRGLGDLDLALAAMARARGEAARQKDALEEQIRILREKAAPMMQILVDAADADRRIIEAFAGTHPEIFPEGRRSLDLPNGRVGYRLVSSIKLPKMVERVVAALKARKLFDAIVTTEKPNKDILAAYDDETLDAVGAKRVTKDEFYVQLKGEQQTGD